MFRLLATAFTLDEDQPAIRCILYIVHVCWSLVFDLIFLQCRYWRGILFSRVPKFWQLNVWLSVGAAGASTVLCLFVLAAAGYIYSKPWARHTIDRLSFRILLWSMAFEVFYDFAFIAVGIESALSGVSNNVCATGVYFMMSTLGVVNYLCTCIAINLLLTVCFKINPLEKGLEKWYVGISVALGMGIPIIPAALGHFGQDPILNVCWIQAKDDTKRMLYFVMDLYLWQALSCLIATVAVIATLVSLFRQRRRLAKSSNLDELAIKDNDHRDILTSVQNQFLKIAILISLYPIALIIVNGFITIGDLYISAEGGVHSQSVYGLYCIYYFLYGGRGVVFACLGIFVDPCLRRGLRIARTGDRNMPAPPKDHDKASLLEILGYGNPMNDLEMYEESISKEDSLIRTRRPSKASIEMVTALSHSPAVHFAQPSNSLQAPQNASFTRSFSGVRAEALPVGLTDDVDVRLKSPSNSVFEELKVEYFEPLDPDLPDLEEERRRRIKAAQVDREEAVKAFEKQQAQL